MEELLNEFYAKMDELEFYMDGSFTIYIKYDDIREAYRDLTENIMTIYNSNLLLGYLKLREEGVTLEDAIGSL